jgi:hypothetical protein
MCSNTPPGSTCDFTCQAGFYRHVSAIAFIFCGLDGAWNSALAECLDETDVVPASCMETATVAACLETTTTNSIADDASACAAVADLTSSSACKAVLTKASDNSQDDGNDAVADVAACTYSAASVQADLVACEAVTGSDLDNSKVCEEVTTAADATLVACTYTAAAADVAYPGSCAHLKMAFPFLPSGGYFIRPSNDVRARERDVGGQGSCGAPSDLPAELGPALVVPNTCSEWSCPLSGF